MRGLVWFNDDLRIHDNPALYHARKQCDKGIIAVYALDPGMWRDHNVAACRVDFVLRGLNELKASLKKINIPFIVFEVKSIKTIPEKLLKLAKSVNATALFYNCQYEVNEKKRNEAAEALFKKNHLQVSSYHDQVILPPGSVLTQQGNYFSVFTPFKNAWIKKFMSQDIKTCPTPKAQKRLHLKIKSHPIPSNITGFKSDIDPKLWPAGEIAANKRLKKFLVTNLKNYKKERDFPAMDSTSKLSAYLSSGMISARECFLSAMARNHNEIDSGNIGASTWLNELIWRDFYRHVMVAAPRVSMHKAYKKETDNIKWNYSEKQLHAWQEGKTGYPFIDAAMRQLNTTGWMHNRMRMVVAMFLSKNLFLDWRLGEKYFLSHLIDGDLASNNGGWQWSASTGTDAAPYFRIFNPILQSKKYDPEGKYILKYCPELKKRDKKFLHDPSRIEPDIAAKEKYPKPIIELNVNREKVLKAYKQLSK
jgi:deoxyribodipyrimidine photo-lyase